MLPAVPSRAARFLSAIWLLGFLSGLAVVPSVNGFGLRLILVLGVIVFLAAGLAGFVIATGFLAYPTGIEKPVILLIEIAMTLSIGATLGLLVAGAPGQPSKT